MRTPEAVLLRQRRYRARRAAELEALRSAVLETGGSSARASPAPAVDWSGLLRLVDDLWEQRAANSTWRARIRAWVGEQG